MKTEYKVSAGKGDRFIVFHVGSAESGLLFRMDLQQNFQRMMKT